MSINKAPGLELCPNSIVRKIVKAVLTGSLLIGVQGCPDNRSYEPPKRMRIHDKKYDYLYDGIEIVPDKTIKEKKPSKTPIIPDDPECTPETCKPA